MTAAPMAVYPLHWEADVLLADGGVVHLRPCGPGDADAIRAMHSRLSAHTLYMRYFKAVNEISDRQIEVFTDVDHDSRVGLVAELGGEIIAAATHYRDPAGDTAEAEAAFLVEDSEQGRGLGSILLEHLAAAAQERGIHRFTAEVLGQNTKMLGVFMDAGYAVHREYDSGVVELMFDIEPTEKSRAVMTAREHRADGPVDHPAGRAAVDRGHRGQRRADHAGPDRAGEPVARQVLRTGVPGHPGCCCGAGRTGLLLRDRHPRSGRPGRGDGARLDRRRGGPSLPGQRGTWPGGDDGRLRRRRRGAERRLVAVARGAGMRVLGPNCLGLVNIDPAVRMNATLAPVVPPPGRVGCFCQSGALGISILADAANRGWPRVVDVRLGR